VVADGHLFEVLFACSAGHSHSHSTGHTEEWKAKGAEFVTPPIDRGAEIRCYLRDPDGYLIEVGQSTGLLHGKLAAKRPEDLPG
jgi:hypothetical protein